MVNHYFITINTLKTKILQQNKSVNSEQNDSSAANWLTVGSESEGHWERMIGSSNVVIIKKKYYAI